ncbi:MAG: TonB family protein [Steroidobacteraceae bacterium]
MRQLLVLAAVPLSAVAIVSLSGCDSRTSHFGSSFRPSSLVTLTSAAPGPSRAPKTDKPQVVSWPDPASLEQLYPEKAAREHINGLVRITVTLDKAGRATDTHILSETPPDLGFGAAASTLAHLMRYSNPTGHIVTVTLPVKFVAPPHLSRLQRKLERLR